MKHKYEILKNEDGNHILIREFAELDKDFMTLVCEETYNSQTIQKNASQGPEALVPVLRTPNFFPAGMYALKIAESMVAFLTSKSDEPVEIEFDDAEFIPKDRIRIEPDEEVEADSDDIDELIEDDFDEEFDEKDSLKKIDSSLKVADDDYDDFDEEN